jgi:hypothetical protein
VVRVGGEHPQLPSCARLGQARAPVPTRANISPRFFEEVGGSGFSGVVDRRSLITLERPLHFQLTQDKATSHVFALWPEADHVR